MSSSFEKSVKGGTKIKLAAPKSKYVEHILVATHAGEAGVAEIFRALQNRLRDSTWTIVFKSLIIVHLMIREGEPNVTLKYLAEQPRKLAISNFSDVQLQGSNIRHYSEYLLERARSYREIKFDFVRGGQGRLKRQSVDKGLLRETESVQTQIDALLKCDLLTSEPENEITLTAFRLLTMDLLVLYHAMNEGTINVLEHYFEMSKYDAERALGIYKTFSKQTDQVVQFLGVARQYENATRLEIPKLKHAPTSLTKSLEEYLNDPDFDLNRRQYLAQQEAKKSGRSTTNGASKPFGDSKPAASKAATGQSFPDSKPVQAAPARQETRGPAPDLIDFFESIEQNQQPMAHQFPQQQVPNFQPAPHFQQQQFPQSELPMQQTHFQTQQPQQPQQLNGSFNAQNGNPFGQPQQQLGMEPNFTGVGFGGYTPQPQQPFSQQQSLLSSIPQDSAVTFPPHQHPLNTAQQQSTNPFRQSMMPQTTGIDTPSYTGTATMNSPDTRQSTNPFSRNISVQPPNQSQSSPFSPQATLHVSQPPPQQYSLAQPLQPTPTGTNPFARNVSPPQQPPPVLAPLMPNPTGSTNPFRQSAFVNQQTGQGWQASQGTIGGLEQMDTVPVFPRPGQPLQAQQQQGWL
ncbi:MAG: hypothetical protein M1830_002169 [Pleopsidium flavum]|nr:MAG: hypothetical protein M1830_002169 [Pleopsidium flavum]